LIGLMVDRLGWISTLASGSLFALIGAALWLLVRVESRSAPEDTAALPAGRAAET
jgi:hypothetical protein